MRAYTGQNIIEKQKAPLPSFLSGGQNQNVDERKEYNMTFSEESGIDYQKMHLTPTFFAWILHSFPYFFITLFPTAFFLRSRMTSTYLMPFHMKSFFRFCSHLPFSAAPPALSSCPGTACILYFLFRSNYHSIPFSKRISPLLSFFSFCSHLFLFACFCPRFLFHSLFSPMYYFLFL